MGKVDSHNNTALRGVLDPISEMAERTNVAFASVTHFTKGTADKGIKAMHRVMGAPRLQQRQGLHSLSSRIRKIQTVGCSFTSRITLPPGPRA
jgi:hypothetical protein